MSRRIPLRVPISPSSLVEASASVFSSHSPFPSGALFFLACHPEGTLFAIRRGSRNESKDLSSCADFAEQSRPKALPATLPGRRGERGHFY